MRIAIAGFQHETNSFAPSSATLREFEMADSWPAMMRGSEVIEGTRGMNLPVAGFVEAAKSEGNVRLVPILWCSAEPSGPVTDVAFETISGEMLKAIREAGPLDGLYLDLHGAMITQGLLDGEGELLARLRSMKGPDWPIVVSLDLHANVSPAMVRLADCICIFRTYPHIDMSLTGARSFRALNTILTTGKRPARAFRQAPFMVPLHAQHTGADPARALYKKMGSFDRTPGTRAELAMGFTAGDTPDTCVSLVVYSETSVSANRIADEILEDLVSCEGSFDTRLLSAADAVEAAMSLDAARPVVIADVQDNPGAGGSSDTTGILKELIAKGAKGVLAGLLYDPDAAARAHSAGAGSVLPIRLGGHSGVVGDDPIDARFQVVRLGDGTCAYTGEMYGGGVATLGPTAVLSPMDTDAEIQIVVTSIRNQCLDLAHFTHLGLDPCAASIIVVKSTAHFRADFEPIAEKVLLASSPGHFPCNLSSVTYRNLRKGVVRL